MKRKTLVIALIVVSVAFAAFYIIKIIGKNGSSKQDQADYFTARQARVAAESGLVSFEPWKDPVLEESYTLYDLNGVPSAYIYNVRDNYGKAGYITVSATSKFDPIIEISESIDTPITKTLQLVKEKTEGTIYRKENVRTKYIYLGDDSYYVNLSFREGDETLDLYYEFRGGDQFEASPEDLQAKQDFYEKYFEDGASEKWKTLLSQL